MSGLEAGVAFLVGWWLLFGLFVAAISHKDTGWGVALAVGLLWPFGMLWAYGLFPLIIVVVAILFATPLEDLLRSIF